MILQCNINRTYKIPMGSHVWIYGHVGAYKAANKGGGLDYCIDNIIGIGKLDFMNH